MSNKIKQLKAARDVGATRLKELYDFSKVAENDTTKRIEFKVRYEYLDSIKNDFENHHQTILITQTLSEADLVTEDEIRSDFDKKYFAIKTTFLTMFPTVLTNSNTVSIPPQQNAKLPKISLPTFDGNLRQWPTFIDLFENIIHKNQNLADIEKFHYLMSHVSGEPQNLIKGTPMTDANYSIALNALKNRYQNKRLLASDYWHQIFYAQKLNSDNPESLRNLIDIFSENLSALSQLGFPTDSWDFILFNILLQKLDAPTARMFELQHSELEIPSYDNLKTFLLKQSKALSSLAAANSDSRKHFEPNHKLKQQKNEKFRKEFSFMTTNSNIKCPVCKTAHLIYKCPIFSKKNPYDRYLMAKENHLCINCLSSSHPTRNCNSFSLCHTCKNKHHTMLHFDSFDKSVLDHSNKSRNENALNLYNRNPSGNSNHFVNKEFVFQSDLNDRSSANGKNAMPSTKPDVFLHTSAHECPTNLQSTSLLNSFSGSSRVQNKTVLLSTALVKVFDIFGNLHNCRVLLDSASQVNVITENCFNMLGLKRFGKSFSIQGLGDMCSNASKGLTSCTIEAPGLPESSLSVDLIILPKICQNMPNISLENRNWNYLSNLKLADPNFHKSEKIDMLLGAEIFPLILQTGKVTGGKTDPVALQTIFGWILMGTVNDISISSNYLSFCTTLDSLDKTISKFWEVEEIPQTKTLSKDEISCENNFLNTHYRDTNGRYVVSLPFKGDEPSFSRSRSLALKYFYSLERRLLQNSELYKSYSEVIQEYLNYGHMKLIEKPVETTEASPCYYIPHHCIIKPESTTTQVRVVYNASARAPEGSLNDFLLPGPKLQKDICSILLNFRRFPIVFTCDIKAMYRQILVSEKHQDYQRILWRFSSDAEVQDYKLTTVTFGMTSSPYLALRSILQLALDNQDSFPRASQVLQSDIFVDDICTGCSSLEDALTLKDELIALLSTAGFELRKWSSNDRDFLNTIPSFIQQTLKPLDTESDFVLKVLGLQWDPTSDMFSYKINCKNTDCTKRAILSDIARIFDPIGFLAPLTFFAKHLMQLLWAQGIGWDDIPSHNLVTRWSQYKQELSSLSNLKIPRCLLSQNIYSLQVHAFADASELGYGACVYFRISDVEHNVFTRLVCAKSKVAPLKKISLPRLELCAAVLVSNLVSFIQKTFSSLQFENLFAWSDSTVALSWIKSEPSRWKTFVSNRVSEIQNIVPPSCWFHVPTKDNPADCASRGLMPSKLINFSLWWKGPEWLSLPSETWPKSEICIRTSPDISKEERKVVFSTTLLPKPLFIELLDRFSSLPKVLRIVGYSLKFTKILQNQKVELDYFSDSELNYALMTLVKIVQKSNFSIDIDCISKGVRCSKPLRKLSPFLDDLGILRVGGRLVHSKLPYEQKHPALLPSNHRLTELIITYFHQKNLHPGLQTLTYLLLQQFWIISSRRTIRRVVSNCIKCFRVNPPCIEPKMVNLPSHRVSEVKPFQCVAVDFAGPFTITMGKHRGAKSYKSYLCVFVCCAVKAIHLELVSDLSSEAFLAALRRFIARRGRVLSLHSDCGTNFIGASKYISEIMANVAKEEHITWSFSPPSSPHFNGLAEASVKSVKSHLMRVIGDQILTYEELLTVFTQIESILNSRPLCAVSSDPNDFSCLSPGHFLTLSPLTSLPDPDLTGLKLARLNRWQLLSRLQQDFWKRWHNEYLHTLTQRGKWTENTSSINKDTLVVIREDNTPPLRWRLGRVMELYPGSDGIVRVVMVRTAHGCFKRPVIKLSPLPTQ